MKKQFTFYIVSAVMLLSFASCKKDYTCTCYKSGNVTADKKVYNQVTKKVAEDKCDVFNRGYSATGGYCSLTSD